MTAPLLKSFSQNVSPPPIWLMRQAGRYLPEYRALREKNPDFIKFCFSPELAVEATLQPLRRFPLDAAIIFSDILVIPEALGQKVHFEPNFGPVLAPFSLKILEIQTDQLAERLWKLDSVFQAVTQVRNELPQDKALIGFAGGPWTLATYMIEEGKSRSNPPFQKILAFAEKDPEEFQTLLALLSETVGAYLVEKLKAGADLLQIFDTWAGVVPEDKRDDFILKPLSQIIKIVRDSFPTVPLIYFAKGLSSYYPTLLKAIPNLAFSLDETVDLSWASQTLQKETLVQGNLDSLLLVEGGEAMDKRAREIINALSKGPFIFNLGHGVLPQTPPSHVERLVELVKGI